MTKTFYIDFHALAVLALMPSEAGLRLDDCNAMRSLWKAFRNDRIKFVTCGKDMENDIILSLNKQGCCITDTLRAGEAIEEFERSGVADKDITKYWKRVILFFEQIGSLPQVYDRDPLFGFFKENMLDCENKSSDRDNEIQNIYDILRDCAKDIHLWYSENQWKDLKYTDYKLNRDILSSVLEKRNLDPSFDGEQGKNNLYLFGLVNRFIGLCKKSHWKLPVDKNHAEFIIKTAVQKYYFCRGDRNVIHVLNSIRNGLDLFLTADRDLINRFNDRKHILCKHPEFSAVKLNLMSPYDAELQIRS